jgi:hypothetical protein
MYVSNNASVLYEAGSRAAGFTPRFLCGCVFCICFVLCPVHVCTMLLVSLDCQFGFSVYLI